MTLIGQGQDSTKKECYQVVAKKDIVEHLVVLILVLVTRRFHRHFVWFGLAEEPKKILHRLLRWWISRQKLCLCCIRN